MRLEDFDGVICSFVDETEGRDHVRTPINDYLEKDIGHRAQGLLPWCHVVRFRVDDLSDWGNPTLARMLGSDLVQFHRILAMDFIFVY